MAIDLNAVYPLGTDPATAAYPLGVVRNVSAQGAGDGTPYDEVFFRDITGFFQKIIADSGIVISGIADTALASDYLDGIQAILDARFGRGFREGGRAVRDSVALLTTEQCSARSDDDSANLKLPASMQKNIKVAWTQGDGNGGTPTALLPLGNQMYRRFLVVNDVGVADICFDTSATAATFFADATAIAAGFTDATLYRRIGWIPIDSGLDIDEFVNSSVDVSVYQWGDSKNFSAGSPVDAADPRIAMDLTDEVPPSCFGSMTIFPTCDLADNGDSASILITTDGQNDTNPATGIQTIQLTQRNNSQDSDLVDESIHGLWEVNAAAELFYRYRDNQGGTGVTTFSSLVLRVDGWVDPVIVP